MCCICSPLSPPAGSHLVQGWPCVPQLCCGDADPPFAGKRRHYFIALVLRGGGGNQFIDEGNRTPLRRQSHVVCCVKGAVERAHTHVREGELFIPEGTRTHTQGLCGWLHASERLNASPSGDHNHFNAVQMQPLVCLAARMVCDRGPVGALCYATALHRA